MSVEMKFCDIPAVIRHQYSFGRRHVKIKSEGVRGKKGRH